MIALRHIQSFWLRQTERPRYEIEIKLNKVVSASSVLHYTIVLILTGQIPGTAAAAGEGVTLS